MRQADRLEALIDAGVIDAVERPLLAGKEAEVYLVIHRGYRCVAKLYKQAEHRSFKHRSAYTEGRRGRNTRRERAIAKGSRYGRAEAEAAWRNAEVDAIYRLRAAGVSVPEPYEFVDGVLVMELVSDEHGEPAPRLCDVQMSRREAKQVFELLLREVVKMLCAGLVHGDLSDFNVLLGQQGPVVIDFPQATDAAANRNARKFLIRDVNNLQSFLGRYVPGLRHKRYGEEIWDLYERGDLHPDSPLTGHFKRGGGQVDTMSLLEEIEAVQQESRRRKGLPPLDSLRKPLSERPVSQVDEPPSDRPKKKRRRRKKKEREPSSRTDSRSEARSGSRPDSRSGSRSGSRSDGRSASRSARAPAPPAASPLDDLDALLSVED